MAILTGDPGQDTLIILGLIFVVVLALGLSRYVGLKVFGSVSAVGDAGAMFIYYVPIALLTFGFVADIISQSFKFSIGSIVGGAFMTLNGAIGYVLKNGISLPSFSSVVSAPAAAVEQVVEGVPSTNPFRAAADTVEQVVDNVVPSTNPFRGGASQFCSVPGLENFDNKYNPQNIFVTVTVLIYYMIGQWESGNASRTVVPGVTLLLIVVSQIVTMVGYGCLDPWWSPIVSIVSGFLSGIIGFHIVKAINGSDTPFIANQTGPKTAGGFGTTEAPTTDATKPADSSKCSQPTDQDEFVCDLYKNGELITSNITSS